MHCSRTSNRSTRSFRARCKGWLMSRAKKSDVGAHVKSPADLPCMSARGSGSDAPPECQASNGGQVELQSFETSSTCPDCSSSTASPLLAFISATGLVSFIRRSSFASFFAYSRNRTKRKPPQTTVKMSSDLWSVRSPPMLACSLHHTYYPDEVGRHDQLATDTFQPIQACLSVFWLTPSSL